MIFPNSARIIHYGNDQEKDMLAMLKGMLDGSDSNAKALNALFVEPILYKPTSLKYDRSHTDRKNKCTRTKGSSLAACPLVSDKHEGPGVTNIAAILDVLCTTKTDREKPFFFMV